MICRFASLEGPPLTVVASRAVPRHRALAPWYVVECCNSYAQTLLTYCAYYYAQRQLGATPSQRLWLAAGWGVTYVAISLLAGRLAHRLGTRRLVVLTMAGSVLTALGGLVMLRAPGLWALFAVMTCYSFTSSQAWPSLEAAVARSPGAMSLPSRLTIYNLTWAATSFLALASADAVMHLGWAAVFIVPSVVHLAAAVYAATQTIPESMLLRHEVPAPPDGPSALAVATRTQTLLLMAWLANAMAYMAINVLIPALPTLTRNMASGSASAGSLWGFARFAGFVLFWVWGAWHYRVRYMLLFHALLAAAFCCLLVFPTSAAVFYGGQVVFGLSIAFIYASSLYYAMHTSAGGSTHASIHEALIGAGVAVGPTIGALAGVGGDRLPPIGLAVATVLVLGGIVLAILGRRAARAAPARAC